MFYGAKLPIIQPKYVIVKHIILFVLGSALLYAVVSLGTKRLLERNVTTKQETNIILVRTVTLILGVVLIVGFQVNYIHKQEDYIDYRCEYYDEYYNLIFASPRIYSCPEINITNKTDTDLQFTTYAQYSGKDDIGSLETLGITDIDPRDEVEVESYTATTIHYDESHRIEYFRMQYGEVITFIQNQNEHIINYSFEKVVESDYRLLSFDTTMKTASIIIQNGSVNTIYHDFDDTDFTVEHTYTTTENLTNWDTTDAEYYIIQDDGNPLDMKLVGLGYYGDFVFYDFTNDFASFKLGEVSNFSDIHGIYFHLNSWQKLDGVGTRLNKNDVFYKKTDAGYYELMSKNFQSPTSYDELDSSSTAFGNLRFIEDGNECYYVMDGMYYKFVKTEYGFKVIDRRNRQYSLFKSIENQNEERNLRIMNDEFLDLFDYYETLVDYKYYVPQIIINSTNPFFLSTID